MLEIFQFDFMIRAFIAGVVVAIIAPLIGNFLVVHRYSLMADTLAHVALLGVAIGSMLDTQPLYMALITTLIAAVLIEQLRRKRKIFGESLLALFLSGSLAIAVVLFSVVDGFNANLFSFLFGSITTVSVNDVSVIALVGSGIFLTIVLLYKELFFIAFDEELAAANGLRVQLFNTLLVMLAALTVALAMRIVGALLIGALMVIPVISAMQIARSFKHTIVLSIIFSLLSVLTGLTLSYYADLASGGTIVVIALIIFMSSSLIRKRT